MITYEPALTDASIKQILALQKENLIKAISTEEAHNQGFVTVEHQFDALKHINDLEPAMTTKYNGEVVGYCLAMHPSTRSLVPELGHFFNMLDQIPYQGSPLRSYPFIVVGQVCIAKSQRGQGHFDKMYQAYRDYFSGRYVLTVTEVAEVNQRSLKAHFRVGFQTIKYYQQPDGRWWHVVAWDWGKQ